MLGRVLKVVVAIVVSGLLFFGLYHLAIWLFSAITSLFAWIATEVLLPILWAVLTIAVMFLVIFLVPRFVGTFVEAVGDAISDWARPKRYKYYDKYGREVKEVYENRRTGEKVDRYGNPVEKRVANDY